MAVRQLQKDVKQTALPRLNAEPKTVVAVILISVMALLWARVFFRDKLGPAAAAAQTDAAAQSQEDQNRRNVQIRPVKLEIVPGRNDRPGSNIFTPANWTAFEWGQENKSSKLEVSQTELTEKNQRQMAEQLRSSLSLEAVIHDAQQRPAQAFVDGRLLEMGSTFTIRRQAQTFELSVKKIENTKIVLVWQEYEIELKMPDIETGQ